MDSTLYWDNKALPTPTRYIIFYFLVISIFIENKCFSDVIWNVKMEKKSLQKRVEPGSSTLHVLPSAPLELTTSNSLLWCWPAQSHIGGRS